MRVDINSRSVYEIFFRIFVGGNGKSVAEDIQKLKKSLHIVVGTTGRLCHLVRIDALRLNYVRLLVLDEADKLMQDDFQQDIKSVSFTIWSVMRSS